MKTLLLLLVVGCGSSSTSPARPVAESKPTPAAPEASPAAPPPAAEPAAPMPVPSLHERLRDFDGPVPGLQGFSIKRTASPLYCGGTKITITRAKAIAADDKQMAAVYAVEFPTGLDFDPGNKAVAEASLKRFNEFVAKLTATGRDAALFYSAKIKDGDAATKMAAVARVAQVQFQVASVLARAEIPKDVRTGEFKDDKTAAFCDKMVEVSEPVVMQAERALETCRSVTSQATAKGWWNEACGSK